VAYYIEARNAVSEHNMCESSALIFDKSLITVVTNKLMRVNDTLRESLLSKLKSNLSVRFLMNQSMNDFKIYII
jgi:hypothetical protein